MYIFVSYSSRDREAVSAVVADLQELGHRVWFDQALTGGQEWWEEVLGNIRACELLVFALTPNSLNSHPCALEYMYAHFLNKRILPILLADVDIPLLPPILSLIQFVDYRQHDKKALLNLLKALNGLPPPVAAPVPLPVPPPVPVSPLGSLKTRIESPTLSHADQADLLLQLKGFCLKPVTSDHARLLLEQMKNRADLFKDVYLEIDAYLKNMSSHQIQPPIIVPPASVSSANGAYSLVLQALQDVLHRPSGSGRRIWKVGALTIWQAPRRSILRFEVGKKVILAAIPEYEMSRIGSRTDAVELDLIDMAWTKAKVGSNYHQRVDTAFTKAWAGGTDLELIAREIIEVNRLIYEKELAPSQIYL